MLSIKDNDNADLAREAEAPASSEVTDASLTRLKQAVTRVKSTRKTMLIGNGLTTL